MKKNQLFLTFLLLVVQSSFAQEFKVDPRTQEEKENPIKLYNLEETSILDLIEILEIQGIKINKFDLGKFDKNYNIALLSDRYNRGVLTKTDTLAQFESTYRYYDGDESYFDYMDKIKIITKDNDATSELFIKTYSFSTEAQIELKKSHENSHFNWRSYKKTDWELNKKIPLMVFASSWKDEESGFDRFCGVNFLTANGKETNELLVLSPSYAMIYYHVTEK